MAYWKVNFIESERGWGSSVAWVNHFPEAQKERALATIQEFNAKNTETSAPDWYMRAEGPYLMEGNPNPEFIPAPTQQELPL